MDSEDRLAGRAVRVFLATLTAVVVSLAAASSAQALVYFVNDDGTLGRANYETGEIQTPVPTGFPLRGKLEPALVESDGNYLYNVHQASGGPQLQRVALDGSRPEVLYNLLSIPVVDLEVSGDWAYVVYERLLGNGVAYFANRVRIDGSGLDESWAPALNGTASCDYPPNQCVLFGGRLTVDESSRSAYWGIGEITGFLQFASRIMRVRLDDDSAITRLYSDVGDPIAGDGHLYWTTNESGNVYLSHASTADHTPDHDFVAGDFEGIGVLGGNLYANGAIISPGGQVQQRVALPAGSVGATVDAVSSFPVFQPCIDARADLARARVKLTKAKKKLKMAKKRAKSAKRKVANASTKEERAKAAKKLRKAKRAVETAKDRLDNARTAVSGARHGVLTNCS